MKSLSILRRPEMTCHGSCYISAAVAAQTVKFLEQFGIKLVAYKCPCGYWHTKEKR